MNKYNKFVILFLFLLWFCHDYRWNPSAGYKARCEYMLGTWSAGYSSGTLQFTENNQFTYTGGSYYAPYLRINELRLVKKDADLTDPCRIITFGEYRKEKTDDVFTIKGTYRVYKPSLFSGAHSVFWVEMVLHEVDDKYIVAYEPYGPRDGLAEVIPRYDQLEYPQSRFFYKIPK